MLPLQLGIHACFIVYIKKGFSNRRQHWHSLCKAAICVEATETFGVLRAAECPGTGKKSDSSCPSQGFRKRLLKLRIIKTLARALAVSFQHAPKTSLIALLALSSLASFDARAKSLDQALREKDVKRAERLIASLRALEQPRGESNTSGKSQKHFEKIPDSLFVEAANLRASHLKTDLTTAIFLYEEAYDGRQETDAAVPDCEGELREVYARLCRENETVTLKDFLKAKARLHIAWAEATIRDYRGIKDSHTTATLEEMRGERLTDLRLAESAVIALKSLEKEVYVYSSLSEFEEQRRLARVPFEQLSEKASIALRRVNRVLLSLPRSALFYSLYHARNAYSNGLFWWQKTQSQSKLVVNVNSFTEPEEKGTFNFDASAVSYTIAIYWRKAVLHTREAEQITMLSFHPLNATAQK
jgi:hypothetical protein